MKKLYLLLFTIIWMLNLSAQLLNSESFGARGSQAITAFHNNTGKTDAFDMGVGIFHPQGYIEPLKYHTTNPTLQAGGSTSVLWFDLESKMPGLTEQDVIVPISRIADTDPWYITLNPAQAYVQKEYSYGQWRLSQRRNNPVRYPLLTPQFSVQGTPVVGQPIQISVRVANKGYAPFNGQVYLTSDDFDATDLGQQALSLAVGAERTLQFTYTPSQATEVELKLCLDAAYTEVAATYRITVSDGQPQPRATYWTATLTPQSIYTPGPIVTPSEAVALGIQEMGAGIQPNSNPNTLYFLPAGSSVPASLAGRNVVVGDKAERLVIEDGKPYETPLQFTATTAIYRRPMGQTTDGRGSGWQTIVLPFRPDEVCVASDGRSIDWRKREGDTGRFWLRELDRVEGTTCHFTDVQHIDSHTPYLLSLPGSTLGALSLAGETLEWKASNVDITSYDIEVVKGNYQFLGTLTGVAVSDAYVLNAEGNRFVKQTQAQVQAQRAYFLVSGASVAPTRGLDIAFDSKPTGLSAAPTQPDVAPTAVYTLAGQRVGTAIKVDGQWQLPQLPRGVYLVGGQRVLR